jgi:hypothetical protein
MITRTMNLTTVTTSSFKEPIKHLTLVQTKPLTWLDHAERHFKNGYISSLDSCYGIDQHLMYLALFSHVGMFD